MRQLPLFTVIIQFMLAAALAASPTAVAKPNTHEATDASSALSYRLNKTRWKLDADTYVPSLNAERYVFSGDPSIDLNVVPINEDLAKAVRAQGAPEFVKQIFSGKNRINKMFGVGESQLVNYKLENFGGVQVLQIRARQQIENEHVSTFEKYYMSNGKTLHVELRWHDTSDSKKQKQAETDLGKIVLRVPASAVP